MKKISQFETLLVEEFELDAALSPPRHTHNFYEIIYIFSGTGNHLINNISLPYTAGNLFIVSPEDEHFFDIIDTTRFATIRFTDNYFSDKRSLAIDDRMVIRPENLMRHKLLKEIKLNLDDPCKTILEHTVKNIVSYNCMQDLSVSSIIYYQILTILGMIQEEIKRLDVHIGGTKPERESILSYIHQNIYYPEKTQVESIANYFNISTKYFGTYFKRNFSITYREYLHNYRMLLIEKRILSNQITMKQIADEFGFTDESHLTNYFKQKNKVTPSVFRKEREESIPLQI